MTVNKRLLLFDYRDDLRSSKVVIEQLPESILRPD